MALELKNFVSTVLTDRNYWLVRSMGGDYYQEFVNRGYIAIGFNEITLNEIKFASSKEENALHELKSIIASKDLDEEDLNKYENYGAVQMLKFYNELKEGDIVIIPSAPNLQKLAIGIIESNVYELQDNEVPKHSDSCYFKKRRKFSLIKEFHRRSLNPEMQLMFNSRHIISNVGKYADFIDGSVRDFYQKGDTTFLVLRVKQENEISALDFTVVPEIINLIDGFAKENDIIFDKHSVKMKICVQSPGDIIVYAQQNPEIVFFIGVVIFLFKGAELKIGEKIKFKIPSGFESFSHLFSSLSDFSDRKTDRKIKETIRKKLENMDIETPDDIKKIMSELNKGRDKY